MPDVELVDMDVDECLEYLLETSAPYPSSEDRLRDISTRLISGFEDLEVNSILYGNTRSELRRIVWSSPRFAMPDRSLYDVDPRSTLRAIAESDETLRVRRRAAKLLRHYAGIDLRFCTCFPGDPETATRAEIQRWLRSKHLPLSIEAAILDVESIPSAIRSLETSAGRRAHPRLAEMLDRFQELAQLSVEWIPFDLYTALDPPRRDEWSPFRVIRLIDTPRTRRRSRPNRSPWT